MQKYGHDLDGNGKKIAKARKALNQMVNKCKSEVLSQYSDDTKFNYPTYKKLV